MAARLLDLMLELFDGGARWSGAGDTYKAGNYCVAEALEFVSRAHRLRMDDALDCLLRAFGKPRDGNKFHLWFANDDCREYSEIENAILRARALARRELVDTP